MGTLNSLEPHEQLSLEARLHLWAGFVSELREFCAHGSHHFDQTNVDVIYVSMSDRRLGTSLNKRFDELEQVRSSEVSPSDKAFMGIEPVNLITTAFVTDNSGATVTLVGFAGTITPKRGFGLYDSDAGHIVEMSMEDITRSEKLLFAIGRALARSDETLIEELTSLNPDGSSK